MFTGIIQATGSIASIKTNDNDSRYVFNTGNMELDDVEIGDSIAVNGTCLTVLEKNKNGFSADLSNETLNLTTLSKLKQGSRLNLEKAMMLSDRINGHLLSGHIDGIGKIMELNDEGRSIRYQIELPEELTKYVAKKGSIAVDGVSLTINEVSGNYFNVNIIPHTLSETIFSDYRIGTLVNIEVDLFARYLDQLINNKE